MAGALFDIGVQLVGDVCGGKRGVHKRKCCVCRTVAPVDANAVGAAGGGGEFTQIKKVRLSFSRSLRRDDPNRGGILVVACKGSGFIAGSDGRRVGEQLATVGNGTVANDMDRKRP